MLWQGCKLALIGLGAGLLGALALTRIVSGLLFEVEPSDPAVMGLVALILILVSIIASLFPSLKATRVDAIVTLRYE